MLISSLLFITVFLNTFCWLMVISLVKHFIKGKDIEVIKYLITP